MLLCLGYTIEAGASVVSDPFLLWTFGRPAIEVGGTYKPLPYPTESVQLSDEALQLVDELAENTHDVREVQCVFLCWFSLTCNEQGWAHNRMQEGWTWGPRVDDRAKRHNCLVPYRFLTESEQDMERAGVQEAVKIIIGLGFSFKRTNHGSHSTPNGPRSAARRASHHRSQHVRRRRPRRLPSGAFLSPIAGPMGVGTQVRPTLAERGAFGSGQLGVQRAPALGVGVDVRSVGAAGRRRLTDPGRSAEIMAKLAVIERSLDVLSSSVANDLGVVTDRLEAIQTLTDTPLINTAIELP